MGQRIFSSFLFLVLIVIGVLLGQPAGAFPALSASAQTTAITPAYILELVGKIIVPATLLVGIARGLFQAINARVVAGTLNPADLVGLLRLPEFWTALISFAVGVVQVFTHVVILDEASQAVLVSSILGVVTILLNSLGARANKESVSTEMIVTGQAVKRTPRL